MGDNAQQSMLVSMFGVLSRCSQQLVLELIVDGLDEIQRSELLKYLED